MAQVKLDVAAPTAVIASEVKVETAASTKDAGRVKIGGGTMRFKSAPAATRDAGRVKVGGGTIQF